MKKPDRETCETDQEGSEFSTVEEAIEEARAAARKILAEKVLVGR